MLSMKNLILLFIFSVILTSCHRAIKQKELFFSPISQTQLDEIKADSTINIWGQIRDGETWDALPFANIAIYKGEDLISRSQTDMDGIYKFTDIVQGAYDFEVSYVGYNSQKISGVVIFENRRNRLDF